MSAEIYPTAPRTTAHLTFSDGQVLAGPLDTPVEKFIEAGNFPPEPLPIACLVNGQLRELTYRADRDLNIHLLTLADRDGIRIYRRSLTFLLVAAAAHCFPEAKIIVHYGLNFGALYCQAEGRAPFTPAELAQIEARMRAMVEADIPILKERVSLDEARQLLEAQGEDDKLRLLKTRRKPYATFYSLNEFRDYMHGYKVPSTRYLKYFGLNSYEAGFILRFPRRQQPSQLLPRRNYPKLVAVFGEYNDWMAKLGVTDVGSLNERVRQGSLHETILVAEALQELRVAQIATLVASLHDRIRLVLIAGPSSSGKTTFSKRLAIQLLAHGIRPVTLGLDDFLVEREETPRDEEGDYDYESIYAQNLSLFNETLLGLMRGDSMPMPHYNFITGKREWRPVTTIDQEHVIIVEGIHGMNPDLVPNIPADKIFRIYVSALTQLNLDRHNRIPTTDVRLLRRIIRDARHRGYSARDTISRWPKVRRGEHHWIFPYQENADVIVNSALVYELAVMKPLAEPLLLQIEAGKPEHVEAKRLLSFLEWFEACPPDLIPGNSLLREFIGGSVLRQYQAKGSSYFRPTSVGPTRPRSTDDDLRPRS